MSLSRQDYKVIEDAWNREVARGRGYDVGGDGLRTDPNKMAGVLRAKLVWPSRSRSHELAIYQERNGSFIAVGDVSDGRDSRYPELWACDIPTNPRVASDTGLRDAVIKLAYEKPELRDHLLPLVVTAAETFECPTCGTKVLKQTGYCVNCQKKVKEAASKRKAILRGDTFKFKDILKRHGWKWDSGDKVWYKEDSWKDEDDVIRTVRLYGGIRNRGSFKAEFE